ncbi:hypothetical protein TWF225_004372 [Orbilia oligospora]|nr:hypothetical protein TWF225_004372 [Orbilia oligospora]KAF3260016.1 hypothetical protein TWF217_005041 [Orbilia oligospora]KAF3267098.1 hypothetical protein TWF128_010053 [Orbilia oligospora]KAF3293405.1 hypothetical protein TWF132_004725 [Orbilia oligospora]
MLLRYIFLAAFAVAASATPEPAPLGLDILGDLLKDGPDRDIKIANGGPVGPGLSELVAIAEAILRKYGISKTYADLVDLDAGLLKIAADILGVNGKEGIIAAPGKLLGGGSPKTSKLDAANQRVLPTDIYKPTLPAAEQEGIKFHNIDVVSFLPGVVDETWIVAFGGKETHFGTNKACFSLAGGNLQLSGDAIKARCLTKDISGENKSSPEEERRPLKEEKCPRLALAGVQGGKVILVRPGSPNVKAEKVEKILGCWGSIPDDILPKPVPSPGPKGQAPTPNMASQNETEPTGPTGSLPVPPIPSSSTEDLVAPPSIPKYAILKFNGVLAQE